MYCTNGFGKFKTFLGHKIYVPMRVKLHPDINMGIRKDWKDSKMLKEINLKELFSIENLLQNWTLYEKGWYIKSEDSIFDSLFLWLTQQSNKRPKELDIIYNKK